MTRVYSYIKNYTEGTPLKLGSRPLDQSRENRKKRKKERQRTTEVRPLSVQDCNLYLVIYICRQDVDNYLPKFSGLWSENFCLFHVDAYPSKVLMNIFTTVKFSANLYFQRVFSYKLVLFLNSILFIQLYIHAYIGCVYRQDTIYCILCQKISIFFFQQNFWKCIVFAILFFMSSLLQRFNQ